MSRPHARHCSNLEAGVKPVTQQRTTTNDRPQEPMENRCVCYRFRSWDDVLSSDRDRIDLFWSFFSSQSKSGLAAAPPDRGMNGAIGRIGGVFVMQVLYKLAMMTMLASSSSQSQRTKTECNCRIRMERRTTAAAAKTHTGRCGLPNTAKVSEEVEVERIRKIHGR